MKRRVAEAEATKRAQQEGDDAPAKFVKFDPETATSEPNPKQPRTTLYSPVYADEISGSPATSSTSRHVRRIVEEMNLMTRTSWSVVWLKNLGIGSYVNPMPTRVCR